MRSRVPLMHHGWAVCLLVWATLAGRHLVTCDHTVHLRVHGQVDLSQFSVSTHGLGPQEASRRRSLIGLQHQTPSHSFIQQHQHHQHPVWGPLASHATYMFSLEPKAFDPEQEKDLVRNIRQQGGAITSYLPPNTWVITASVDTAHWLAQIKHTVLAPFPPHLKIAPEWVDVLDKQGYKASAAAVRQLLAQHSEQAKAGSTRGPAPVKKALHSHGNGTGLSSSQDDAPGPRKHTVGQPRFHAGSQGADQYHSAANQKQNNQKFLIEIEFPYYGLYDRQNMGLKPHSIWLDPLQHSVNPSVELRAHVPGSPEGAGLQQGCWRGQGGQLQGWACGNHWANGTYLPGVAAAMDWHEPLQSVAQACSVDIVMEHGSLLVAACEQDLVSVLTWLAAQPSVRLLAPSTELHMHNLITSVIVQSGAIGPDPIRLSSHPIWQAGIDGAGQIIGAGDSGIDMDSCFFYDPNVPFGDPYMRRDEVGRTVFQAPNHRKLVLYYGFGDMNDANGHGTHTQGTLAGLKLGQDMNNNDPATGQAPGARLAFLDLSAGSSSVVTRPGDIYNSYYMRTYNVGARIHSDSWGGDNSFYDSVCNAVDRFAYENPDFLPIFAAGNSGDNTDNPQEATIKSPALAKNAIAAGATLKDTKRFTDTTVATFMLGVSIFIPGASSLVYTMPLVGANFGNAWDSLLGQSLTVSGASPADACSGLNSGVVAGTVLIAERGNCRYSDKVRNAQQAGAVGLIVTNNVQEGYFTLNSDGSGGANIPLGGVPKSSGRHLWLAAENKASTITISGRDDLGEAYDFLAAFSSFGPAPDDRIKPDLVAPGILVSAGTDRVFSGSGQCDARSALMQGTSMATPVVAGSAALVRQFFTDGFYPTGSKDPTHVYASPSGALIRAVMVAGAAPIKGNIQSTSPSAGGLPVEQPPSVRQGWGRIDLSGSLPVPGSPKNWRLQVVDKAPLTQDQQHRYCVQATGGPLRVVLVWHDFPGDPLTERALVNDLNLEVRAAGYGGIRLLGNGWLDNLNNVETVLLDNTPAGNVAITVSAATVKPDAPQTYSLVVLGKFSGVLQSPNNPVDGGTETSGSCVITLAVIDDDLSTTQAVSNNNNLKFVFRTASGTDSATGFECQLTNSKGELAPAPLHDWRACKSPAEYPGVGDGTYVFQVRSAGEDVSPLTVATRTFTIDTTPPVTSIAASLPLVAGTPLTTTTENITFTLSAKDATEVHYECMIKYTWPQAGALANPYLKYFRALPPNSMSVDAQGNSAAGPCTSPLTITGLSYGDWELTVMAIDEAGNVDTDGEKRQWAERFTAGARYARLSSEPPALTNNASLVYSLYSFEGVQDAPPTPLDPAPFEVRTWRSGTAAPASWNPIPGSSFLFNVPANQDGDWFMTARHAGVAGPLPDVLASSTITVDTTPPKIVVKQRPTAFSSNQKPSIKYDTDPPGDAVRFDCRWLSSLSGEVSPDTADAPPTAFTDCNSTSGLVAQFVTNGWWLFQVRAWDKAGNRGVPANVSFLTDLDPPSVTNVAFNGQPLAGVNVYNAYTRTPAATISYQVADNPAGSGLANFSCTMKVVTRVTKPAPGGVGPRPGPEFRDVTGPQESPCPNPAKYALNEGRYQFSLQAQDKAGLRTSVEMNVVLDLQAPVTKVTTPIPPVGMAKPSKFDMLYSAEDLPSGNGNAGINRTECMMSIVPASIGSAALTLPNTNSSQTPGQGVNATTNIGNRTASPSPRPAASSPPPSGRRLQQTAPRLGADVDVVWDTWQPCSASPVTYQFFPSGIYTFKARSIDNAGNIGNASDAFTFRVDDTLPIDPNTGVNISPGGDSKGLQINKLAIGIIIGVSVLIIIGIVVAVITVRRRERARQAALAAVTGPSGQQNGLWGGYTTYPPNGYPPHGPTDPYVAAVQAQARDVEMRRQWEEERVRQAIQASLEEENMRKALQVSRQDYAKQMEEAKVQAAIRASLNGAPPR